MTTTPESPLAVIEQAVHDRARTGTLRVDTPEGERELRRLIDEEVSRWQDDHRRGLRPFRLTDTEALAERTFLNVARYGPLTSLLVDDDVWEIMINAPDPTFAVTSYSDPKRPSRESPAFPGHRRRVTSRSRRPHNR